MSSDAGEIAEGCLLAPLTIASVAFLFAWGVVLPVIGLLWVFGVLA